MSEKSSLHLTATIRQWLSKATDDAGHAAVVNAVDVGSLPDATLAKHLFDASAGRLTLLCQSIIVQVRSRRVRTAAADVETQFSLFGKCFEQGKLEACLEDDELLQLVLKHLTDVGVALLSGN
jgi:hypothetical protein